MDHATKPTGDPRPYGPGERLQAIDILRGLALFGVLAINLETSFRVSIFQQLLPQHPPAGLERMVQAVLDIFIDMKAFALFSLLFGVGLAIQFDRMPPSARPVLLVRRLLALLAFGVCHIVFLWEGDILVEYAVAGLLVLPFLFGPTWLMSAACAALLTFYLAMPFLPALAPFPTATWLMQQLQRANAVYPHGGYGAVLQTRLGELPGILVLHIQILPRTLGLFLFGALSWRLGFFRRLAARRKRLGAIAGLMLAAGLAAVLATTGRAYTGWPSVGPWDRSLQPAGEMLLAMGYAALVLAICSGRGARLLAWAAPLGRTAFTNYILQTVILSLVFYGYGLGLFGKLDLVSGLGVVVALYIAQALVSRMWLRAFRFGPLEWLWRVLTYGRRLRLRKGAPSAQPEVTGLAT